VNIAYMHNCFAYSYATAVTQKLTVNCRSVCFRRETILWPWPSNPWPWIPNQLEYLISWSICGPTVGNIRICYGSNP